MFGHKGVPVLAAICPRLSGRTYSRPSGILRIVLGACLFAVLYAAGTSLPAQKYFPTATKRADLEVGGGYVFASPDYSNVPFRGITGYAALDFAPHFGAEFDIHQVYTTGDDNIYERSYEIGPRYVRHFGRYNPYLRLSYGRGVFNFSYNEANLAYNIFAGAAGIDIRVKPHIYARAEYEAQDWLKFQGRNLQPDVFTIGAAYHF